MNDLIQSLPSPSAYSGNYSHMDGGIMDGRWRGVGDDDGDDLLQFPVPAKCQNGVSGPIGFSMAAALWRFSGIMVEPPVVFRSRGLSTPEGDSGTWPSRPPHRVARPRAHPRHDMVRGPRGPPPSRLLAPRIYWKNRTFAIFSGDFPES